MIPTMDSETLWCRLGELIKLRAAAIKRHRKRTHLEAEMVKIRTELVRRSCSLHREAQFGSDQYWDGIRTVSASEPVVTRQQEADQELKKWQESDEGRAERYLYELCQLVDDVTNSAKTRDGYKSLRADYPRLLDAERKLSKLAIQMRPLFAVAV